MSETFDLLPCPFCGSEIVGVVGRETHDAVECIKCRTRGPHEKTPSGAATAWNRRPAEEGK